MERKITQRILTFEDGIEVVKKLFQGDTSKQVAPPTEEWFDYVTAGQAAFCLIHSSQDNPIAVTQFDCHEDSAYVSIFIHEDERGKGFFNHILTSAIRELPEGVSNIKAFISEANHSSIAAFKKFGFKGELERDEDGLLIFTFNTGEHQQS